MIIEGSISVKAAITNSKREVTKVYIDKSKKTKDFNYIRKLVKNNNIELIETTKEELTKLSSGKSFGGILAEATNRKYDELKEGDIFYFDGIEDPFNLGYMMRNVYAFGINNVLLTKRDYTNMESQLLKSSAGAYDMLNISLIDNEEKTLKELKEKGYHIYALKRGEDSKDIFNEEFKEKALFMIGGEKRGIKKEILKLADTYLYIPYGQEFRNSLNATNALAVVSTLLFKQRKK